VHSCGRIGEFSPQYSVPVLMGESNVAIVPAIGGYGVEDIYLGPRGVFTSHRDWQPEAPKLQVQVEGDTPARACSHIERHRGIKALV